MKFLTIVLAFMPSILYAQYDFYGKTCSAKDDPSACCLYVENDEYLSPKLEGIIAYTNTGQPIKGMKVELHSENWGKLLDVSYTDANGHFSFRRSTPGKYYIIHGKTGYSTTKAIIRVTPKAKQCAVLITEGCLPPKS